LGLILGAAFAHNFNAASSPAGPAPYGPIITVFGLAVCILIGLTMRERRPQRPQRSPREVLEEEHA